MKKRIISQVSAGGVVFRDGRSKSEVCLVSRYNSKKKLVWCLPKGHQESGETLEETALREVREEAGLHAVIAAPLGFIAYEFYEPKSKLWIAKKVHFFHMNYKSGKTSDHDDEVEDAKWFDLEAALEVIEYEGESDTLKKAIKKAASYERSIE